MNKKILISTNIAIYIVIIFLSCYFIMIPNIKKLNETNKTKVYTNEERVNLINETNRKYDELEKQKSNEYIDKKTEIQNKYDKLNEELKTKYDRLISEMNSKYDKKYKEYSNKMVNVESSKNREFWANGFSKRFYELDNEYVSLAKARGKIETERAEEKRNYESEKYNETARNNELLEDEIANNSKEREKELDSLYTLRTNELNKINSNNRKIRELKRSYILCIIISIVIIVLPLIYVVFIYNYFTKLLNNVKEKWSQVEVMLKQRTDLIPNIVETVKGYSNYEKKTLTEVINARNEAIKSSNKEDEIETNKKLGNLVKKMIVSFEKYPELKADKNFMDLQNNLVNIENSLSLARSRYNRAVLAYKNSLEMFPSNMFGIIFNFKPEMFFEMSKDEAETIKIKF